MKIIKLEAQNIKRLKAITIYPKGGATLIGGRNAQGKSSTLDAIEMALGGTKSIPEEPIRREAKKGHIVLETDELLIERTFSSKGSKLLVRNKAGVEQKGPQALLDSLFGSLAFDPFKFSTEKPQKQAEIIRKLAGLDFSTLDNERARAFSDRTEVNRDAKRLSALLESLPEYDGVPAVEVSAEDIRSELAHRNAQQAKSLQLTNTVNERQRDVSEARSMLAASNKRIAELEAALLAQNNNATELRSALLAREESLAEAMRLASEFEPAPVDEPLEKLRKLEETNRKVRANAERVSVRLQLTESEEQAAALTAKIEAIDEKKAALIESAKLPVPGLGFDENGPTLNGIALQQCSQAERLQVSVAIGMAFNPKLRVMLVREGAFLDEDSLALLARLAEEADAQVFIERVGNADAGAIIIEDGMIFEEAQQGAAE
jgi:DNA repair exonuclease SbcCD ATPase subunit